MTDPKILFRKILSDAKVQLSQMFDRNFEIKGFFGTKWIERKDTKGKGSLLHVTGNMRRSIRAVIKGMGILFKSALPYPTVHNEGGRYKQNIKAHTRKRGGKEYNVRSHSRSVKMPQRQFIGDSPEVRKALQQIINEKTTEYFKQLAKDLKN